MVMWVAAPRMKRKRKTAVMGMSMFFLGMPPRVQMAGRHGPELDWEMLGYMLEWMVLVEGQMMLTCCSLMLSTVEELGGRMLYISTFASTKY